MTLPGNGDSTVPALDKTVPDLAQLLMMGLLNSYISPRHHSVSTCTKPLHVRPSAAIGLQRLFRAPEAACQSPLQL